jgi:rfaE bifunctional protein kinase chain/domain
MNKLKRVFISGTFNVLHPGHLRLFKYAKELGDFLIVGITKEEFSKPPAFISFQDRLESLTQCKLVDQIIQIDSPICDLIDELKPEIVLKGKEFENLENEESKVLAKYGGALFFSSGDHVFNSRDLLNVEHNFDSSKILFPKNFAERYSITNDALTNRVRNFAKKRILVLGDVILDEYINCEPIGLSQEDGNVIASPIDSFKFIGGAGIVAKHAQGLGAKTTFISVIGKDAAGEEVITGFDGTGINSNFFYEIGRKTSLKKRFRLHQRPVFRVSELSPHEINLENQKLIYEMLTSTINQYDLIILSDFNYGVLGEDLVDKILTLAKINQVVVAADCQSSSQYGNIFKYRGVNLITPTEHEIRLALRNQDSGLAELSREFFDEMKVEHLIMTLGADGLFLKSKSTKSMLQPELIPSLTNTPVDVSGAGDSLLVISSLALVCGASLEEAAFLGSIGAAIQVQRVGNIPINSADILSCIIK